MTARDAISKTVLRDAHDMPICVGDKVRFRSDAAVRVESIGPSKVYREADIGFFGSNGAFYGSGTLCNIMHV